MTNLCQELGVHAENLFELNAWKMVEQQVYANEGRIVNYQLLSPVPTASTVDIVIEPKVTDPGVYTASTMVQDVELISPLSPPNTPRRSSGAVLSESQAATSPVAVKKCRLVLRLPPSPPSEEGTIVATRRKDSKRKGEQKRVQRRKAVLGGECRVQKRAKK
jgi:hypothetical protein